MTAQDSPIRSRQGGQPGQMLVIFALTLTVFLGMLMLGVDLSHLRTEAENAQRAANAAALAGVIFMPTFQSQAYYRAQEEATKNGFTTDSTKGITVTPAAVPGYSYRLKVTISEPVSLFFGQLFGLGKQMISRSATAEYLPPLQMGSPDYVLGYPRFPTTLVPSPAPENYYLNQNGPYDFKENGDPYSTYFESFATPGPYLSYGSGVYSPITGNNSSTPCGTTCSGTTRNYLNNAGTPFKGYDYTIIDPLTTTTPLLIKLFDPFSEFAYDQNAHCWDQGKKGYNFARFACNSTTGSATSSYAPEDIQPMANPSGPVNSSNCVLGTETNPSSGSLQCRNEMADRIGGACTPTYTACSFHGTSLQFQLYGPGQTILDPALQTNLITQTGVAAASATPSPCKSATNCVIAQPFSPGEDPTHCLSDYCSPSSLAFHLVNYAVIHGPGVFRLNVQSVQNADGTYGTGGNAYGIAVCDASSDATFGSNNPLGSTSSASSYVTADPMKDASGHNVGWNSASCNSPNPASCTNPRLAAPGTCVQVYAAGRLPLWNYVSAGSSLIPLGYIPPDYEGRTLNVDLFDPGDVAACNAPACVPSFGCLTPPPVGGSSPVNSMEVLLPSGDLGCGHVDGGTVTGADGTPYPSSVNYSYHTAPDDTATGYNVTPLQTPTANMPLDVGNGTKIYDGSWIHMQVPIPTNYGSMVQNFGGYWKVLYRIGGDAHDVTTWSISVEGSAVHLVT